MTIKQLKVRICKTEEALKREHYKNIEKISNIGWGSGMRKVRIGSSFRRENEIEARLENYTKQLAELEGKDGFIERKTTDRSC